MVGDDMDPLESPAVELSDQPGESLHLDLQVADQGLSFPVANAIDLVVA